MPRTKMSANPALQQTYYRFNIYQPQTCSGQAAKVANIRREIEAIKQEKQAFLRENTKLGRLNKGLLGARLIKETCYSFLDLTSALASDLLKIGGMPDAYGKKISLVATMGMGAIDMTQATTEVAYGQGTWGNVVETGLRSAINIVDDMADGVPQKSYTYLGKKKMNIYDVGKGSLAGDQDQVHKAVETMVFDNVTFVLEMTKENLTDKVAKTRISWLKSGVKSVKAVRRYGQVLDHALEEYRTSTEDTQRSRQVITEVMKRSIERSEEGLNQALREYHKCMQPGGAFPLG